VAQAPFFWLQPARRALYLVLPAGAGATAGARETLERASALVPDFALPVAGRSLRVLVGLDALRERVLAQDEGVSDDEVDALRTIAELGKRARDGRRVDFASPELLRALANLPAAARLPASAARHLRALFDQARKAGPPAMEARLFEARFGIGLDLAWTRNRSTSDTATLWTLLEALPDLHVEANDRISEILHEEGSGGWYDPETFEIGIGADEIFDREGFEDVVRHEVGHAVHEQRADLVEGWLEDRFGWRTHAPTTRGIDAWVKAMGGWGEATSEERAQVRRALRLALGDGGRWGPAGEPDFPPDHLWHRAGFGPRLAVAGGGEAWWARHRSWHRSGGRAFALNHWYGTLLEVDEETLRLVDRMPDAYAAMSHFEFFAELYALHYDRDDPLRRGIPREVGRWMREALEGRAPPRQPARRAKEPWESIRRPSPAR
jgi:hypothetical protein